MYGDFFSSFCIWSLGPAVCAARCDVLCAMPLSLSVPPTLWWSIFDQRIRFLDHLIFGSLFPYSKQDFETANLSAPCANASSFLVGAASREKGHLHATLLLFDGMRRLDDFACCWLSCGGERQQELEDRDAGFRKAKESFVAPRETTVALLGGNDRPNFKIYMNKDPLNPSRCTVRIRRY